MATIQALQVDNTEIITPCVGNRAFRSSAFDGVGVTLNASGRASLQAGGGAAAVGGQRDVDGLGGKTGIERGRDQRFLGGGDRRADAFFEPVDGRTFGLALVRRHRTERLEQRGDRAAFAERGDAHGFERRFILAAAAGCQQFGFKLCDVGHGYPVHRHRPRKRTIQ